MTDVIKMLRDEEQIRYVTEMDNELNTMLVDDEIPFKVLSKIADINATNIMLVETEEELKKVKTEMEYKQLNLKNSTTYEKTYKTLKQREEKAKMETFEYYEQIIELERKKQILLANRQGTEYELRLYYKMMDLNGDINETR